MTGEQRLFTGNKMTRDSQKEQLELSISQTGEEINGMEARLAAKEEEIKLVSAEREKLAGCSRGRSSNTPACIRCSATGRESSAERGEIAASIARAKVRTSEIRLQIIASRSECQHRGAARPAHYRRADRRIERRKVAIEDRLARTEIKAPIAGYVNELFVFTVGGVITPAARIATIVPDNAQLQFETKISLGDIDQVREGQPARVRLTSFNRATTPEFKATSRRFRLRPRAIRQPARNTTPPMFN